MNSMVLAGISAKLRGTMSLAQFHERYGREEQCHEALAAARWPGGFRCPGCDSQRHSRFYRKARLYWQCSRCRQQVSAIAGTLFQGSKLPLTVWFLGIHLITRPGNGVSAAELSELLGVSYKSAWLLKHKLLNVLALRAAQSAPAFGEPVPVRLVSNLDPLTSGRSWKRLRLGIRFCPEATAEEGRLRLSILGHDDSRWTRNPSPAAAPPISEGAPAPISPMRRPHTLISNLRLSLMSTYRGIDARKYGERYIAEYQYRFNQRDRCGSRLGAVLAQLACAMPQTAPQIRAG
jgi:ribosomal protein L37AE/L43A